MGEMRSATSIFMNKKGPDLVLLKLNCNEKFGPRPGRQGSFKVQG